MYQASANKAHLDHVTMDHYRTGNLCHGDLHDWYLPATERLHRAAP